MDKTMFPSFIDTKMKIESFSELNSIKFTFDKDIEMDLRY